MRESVKELSLAQKRSCVVFSLAVLGLAVIFLIVCAVSNALPPVADVLAVTILLAFFACFLFHGILQKNPVSGWLAVCFLTPAIMAILVRTAPVAYAQIYPIFIVIPSLASFTVGIAFLNLKPHIPCLIFFGGLSVLFSLQSSGLASFDTHNGWLFTGIAVGVFVVLSALYLWVNISRKDTD